MSDHETKRDTRVINYQKLIDALANRPMSIEQMAAVIGCKDSTARRYQIALLHHKIIQRVTRSTGKEGEVTTYAMLVSANDVGQFLEFIASCSTIEDEIDQPRRRREDVGDLARQIVVNVKATQSGASRHWLDVALFGNGPAHSVVHA